MAVGASVQEGLEAYARLVRAWAPRLDLVAPEDLSRFEDRHIEDSLKVLPTLAELPPGPCADVGSGAGLPGVPLAIASGRRWRLFEPRRRRAGFLEEVVRELELDCEVHRMRAEEAGDDPRFRAAHALAVARAVAEPGAALSLLAPLVAPGGAAVTFVGARGRVPQGAAADPAGLAIVRLDPT